MIGASDLNFVLKHILKELIEMVKILCLVKNVENFEKNTKAIAHGSRAKIENFIQRDNGQRNIPSQPSLRELSYEVIKI